MNGATALVQTLLSGGLDTCFANPGTSEMHFVAALDAHPDFRCVLCLFEGGTTGAADGYFRMTGSVAATLLHLAPGFGNAFANAHNAAKAGSGVLNIVGDHADYHLVHDSPLKGNVAGVVGAVSHWMRIGTDGASIAADGAAGLRAARSSGGRIASLILPANTAWQKAHGPADTQPTPPRHRPEQARIDAAAKALAAPGAALMVGRDALFGAGAEIAGRIAAATGCGLFCDYFVPRLDHGEGAVDIQRLAYRLEDNQPILAEVRDLILVGARPPVAFFAYPGKPSTPEPPGCRIEPLCRDTEDVLATLKALETALGAAGATARRRARALPDRPSGRLTPEAAAAVVARQIPEGAILVDESITVGGALAPLISGARRHDLLNTMGGAIGGGLPCATGAAIACPDRPVLALTGDGSAMYTLQSLWTMAREGLDVTVLVFANGGYRILHAEMQGMGVETPGRNAERMFDITGPTLDWVALAAGHGVPGEAVDTAEALETAIDAGLQSKGPYLIEVRI